MADRFSATVRRTGDAAVIDLVGDVDGTAAPALSDAWNEAVKAGATRIVLNFAALSYMNSTGIAVIVEILGRARTAGVELRACALSEHYRQIFEITRLSDFMPVHADELSAVA